MVAWRIKEGQVDAFYVKIDKKVGIDTRRLMVRDSKIALALYRHQCGHPEWSDWKVRLELIKEQLPVADGSNLRRIAEPP